MASKSGPASSLGSGSASPSMMCIAESSSNKKPAPPASTTPACFNTGSCSGVFASAARPATRALCKTARNDPPPSAAMTAASADSRTTVRMVPSMGFNTASYAATEAAFKASASFAPLTSVTVEKVPAMPRKICDKITPLFPRAPMSEPWLTAWQVEAKVSVAPSSSATTASSVRDILVPVSPSGTGYTLRRLMPAAWAFIVSRKVTTVWRKWSADSRSSVGTSLRVTILYSVCLFSAVS